MQRALLILFLSSLSVSALSESVSTDRYTLVSVEPRVDQREPLVGVVNIHFSNESTLR